MQIERPTWENKWNLNTVLTSLIIIGMFVTGVTAWNSQNERVTDLEDWKKELSLEIARRREISSARDAASQTKDIAQDAVSAKIESDMSRLQDRVAGNEKAIEATDERFNRFSEVIGQVRDNIADLKAQVQVVQTVLTRMETARVSQNMMPLPSELRARTRMPPATIGETR